MKKTEKSKFEESRKKYKGYLICFACLLTIIIVFIQLFVPPYVGYANNGDFQRMSQPVGIYYIDDPWLPEKRLEIFNTFMTPYFKTGEPLDSGFRSSAESLIKASLFLQKTFSSNTNVYDIRWLGATLFIIYVLLILICFFILFKSKSQNLLVGIFLFIFFIDSSHIAYFNTFYGEGTALIFLLLLIACLFLWIQATKLTTKWCIIIAELVCCYFFITSKHQNILSFFPIGILIGFQVFEITYNNYKKITSIILVMLVNVSIIIPVFLFLSFSSSLSNNLSTANVMFRDILDLSDNPSQMLLSAGFTKAEIDLIEPRAGTTIFNDLPEETLELIREENSKFNRKTEIEMLLSEPKVIGRVIARKCTFLFTSNPLGMYQIGYGFEPYTQSKTFDFYSSLSELVFVNHWIFYFFIAALVGIKSLYEILKNKYFSKLTVYHIVLFLLMTSLLLAATEFFGDSSHDSIKHLYFVNETFYLLVYISLYLVVFKNAQGKITKLFKK